MAICKIFSLIESKKIDNGAAFIITEGNHIIEASLYGGFIIHLKCRALSLDQIVDTLSGDKTKDVNVNPAQPRLDLLQPAAIEKTFPLSSPYLFDAAVISPRRLVMILRLMGQLVRAGDEGLAAFDVISHELAKRYPKFSLDGATLQKRMQWFRDQYGIQALSAVGRTAPPEGYETVPWAFDMTATLDEGLITDSLHCFTFLGDLFQFIFRAPAKKEAGLGAKNGHVRVSSAVYETQRDSRSVMLFRAEKKLGELEINWHSDKRPELFVTKNDLEKLRIGDGDHLNVILKK